MYINELGMKEINQYYARHGGRRSATIKNFANYMDNAKSGRISTAKAHTAAPINTKQAAGAGTLTKTGTHNSRQATPETQPPEEETGSQLTGTPGSEGFCCGKCQLTSQLMLRMMANNLYPQAGLGYNATGSGALAAYQSLSKYFGNGVFS